MARFVDLIYRKDQRSADEEANNRLEERHIEED